MRAIFGLLCIVCMWTLCTFSKILHEHFYGSSFISFVSVSSAFLAFMNRFDSLKLYIFNCYQVNFNIKSKEINFVAFPFVQALRKQGKHRIHMTKENTKLVACGCIAKRKKKSITKCMHEIKSEKWERKKIKTKR